MGILLFMYYIYFFVIWTMVRFVNNLPVVPTKFTKNIINSFLIKNRSYVFKFITLFLAFLFSPFYSIFYFAYKGLLNTVYTLYGVLSSFYSSIKNGDYIKEYEIK